VAAAIHATSPRCHRPMVSVNMASVPASMAATELFGHQKGSFTGATRDHAGYFERADGSTLFLDEVTEMSPGTQVKLLRVLQDGEYERVGGTRTLEADCRILSATNRDLDQAVAEGRFREDLYYRLNVIRLLVPPLRERSQDVSLLAQFFLARYASKNRKDLQGFTPEALEALGGYRWPGNVRELENAVRASLAHAIARGEAVVRPEHLMPDPMGVEGSPKGGLPPLPVDLAEATDAYQRRLVEASLAEAGGHRTRAAELLGVSRQWLHRLTSRWKDEG